MPSFLFISPSVPVLLNRKERKNPLQEEREEGTGESTSLRLIYLTYANNGEWLDSKLAFLSTRNIKLNENNFFIIQPPHQKIKSKLVYTLVMLKGLTKKI